MITSKLLNKFLVFLTLTPFVSFFLSKTSIELPYYDIICFPILLIWVILFSKQRIKRIPKFLIFYILYSLYIIIWAILSNNGWKLALHSISFILFYLIVYNTYFSEKFIQKLFLIFKITIVVAFIFSIIQFFLPEFFISDHFIEISSEGTMYTTRRPSIFSFGNNNDMGLSLLPMFSLLISYLFTKTRKFNIYIFWFSLVGIIAILSNSRYIILGFVLVILQIPIVVRSNHVKYLSAVIIVFIIVFVFTSYVGYQYDEFKEQRLLVEGSFEESSRYLALEAFLKYFPEAPWFGTGKHLTKEIDEFLAGRSSQIHVGYLSHLVSYGIIGSLLLFTSWILILIRLIKNARHSKYWGAAFGWLIFIWANFTFVRYSLISYGLLYIFVIDRFYATRIIKQSWNEKIGMYT